MLVLSGPHEEVWRRFIEYTSDAVFIDADGKVAFVNPAGAELYGATSVNDLIGRNIVDLVPIRYREFLAGRPLRLSDGSERPHWAREQILRLDGVEREVEAFSTPAVMGDLHVALVMLRDMSDRHALESDLAARQTIDRVVSEVSLRLAAAGDDGLDEAIRHSLAIIAEHEAVDRAYVSLVSDDGLRFSNTHEWLAPGVEAHSDYVQDLALADFPWSAAMLERGEIVHAPQLSDLPPEATAERESFGRYGVLSVLQVPMMSGGRLAGIVGYNTVRREKVWPIDTQDLLLAVTATIGSAIDRRATANEVRMARDSAEEASRAKTDFISRMSHELRTPLHAIIGFAELMSLDERTDADREAIDQISWSGRHLLSLVNDLLDLSRIESDGWELEPELVELGSVVGVVGDLFRADAAANEVTITVDRSLDDQTVRADRRRLQQVFINLVSNAVKYNVVAGTVEIAAGACGEGRARVEVKDTGIGIPTERLDRVFEPFDRLGAERSSVPGTGIGLGISRTLVERMGGRLGLSSRPGVGTTVWVEFDRVDDRSDAP